MALVRDWTSVVAKIPSPPLLSRKKFELCATFAPGTKKTPHNAMASVYKSLSKTTGQKEEETSANGIKRNKQRVLILSSRGITYR